MERLCFTLELVPGKETDYQQRHDQAWPEMLRALHTAGYRNYTLFRRGSTVVGYAECEPDVATVLAAIGSTDVNQRWSESFDGIIAGLTDEQGDLRVFAEVWHLDDGSGDASGARSLAQDP